MSDLKESSQNEEDTIWIYLLIFILIIVVFYFLFTKKENFLSNLEYKNANRDMYQTYNRPVNNNDNMDMYQTYNRPVNNNDNRDMYQTYNRPVNKIIQKINKTAKALDKEYDIKPDLDQTNDTDQIYDIDESYPNLNTTKPYISKDAQVQNISQMPLSTRTPDDRSLKLMNEIGYKDSEKVSCNMLGVNSDDMDNYKKKFYNMYAHQIECPTNCALKADGMSKGCDIGTKCGLQANCSNVNTDTSIPDTFALNYLALDNANKKSCVTCNFKPTKNPLNREWMERDYPSYDGLPEDVKMADEARKKKMNLIDANVSNYANFKNNVYQDSIGESAPDRINEIRTCQDAYGTCGLKNYGTSIANAYDKLTANPSFTSRNDCNPYQLTGILEDSASTDIYANV